jgi:hypothetical protein
MGPVSSGSVNVGAVGRSRSLGTNRGPSHALSPTPGGPGYVNGIASSITFDGDGRRQFMKQGGPPLSAAREFRCVGKGADEDNSSTLEIRVQVEEEVQLDYDSTYAGPEPNAGDNVGVACYQSKRPLLSVTLTFPLTTEHRPQVGLRLVPSVSLLLKNLPLRSSIVSSFAHSLPTLRGFH